MYIKLGFTQSIQIQVPWPLGKEYNVNKTGPKKKNVQLFSTACSSALYFVLYFC